MCRHTRKKRTRGSGLVGTRINPVFLLAYLDLVLDLDMVVDLFEAGLFE
jgi:hypothetical protein